MENIQTKNIHGFEFFSLVEPFKESDLLIRRGTLSLDEKRFEYLSENTTLDIEVVIKDIERKKGIDSFLIKNCNTGVRFELELTKIFELKINKRGRGDTKTKIDRILKDAQPVLEQVASYDATLLADEFNKKLQFILDKHNQKTKEELIEYYSKVSSFKLDENSDEYRQKAEKIKDLETQLQEAKKDLQSYKTDYCIKLIDAPNDFDENDKIIIKTNLESNRHSVPFRFK